MTGSENSDTMVSAEKPHVVKQNSLSREPDRRDEGMDMERKLKIVVQHLYDSMNAGNTAQVRYYAALMGLYGLQYDCHHSH